MADPFIGEIRVFSFTFAPVGWAECRGQLMPITQNKALWSLIETRYGGDGKNTFALPNFEARAPISQGQGEGSSYDVGDEGGTFKVTLTEPELAGHSHPPLGTNEPAELQAPAEGRILARSSPGYAYHGEVTKNLVKMSPRATNSVGSGQPHDNTSPAIVLRYCIALQGVFPNRP
jgi:microcystin-dependent protein